MKTGLVDIKGHEIELGDKIRFLYADPLGRLDQDTLDDGLYEVAFEQGAVMGKYLGGHGVEAENPRVLRNWMETEEGKYISNYGTLTVYPDNKVLCEIVEKGPGTLDTEKLLMTLIDNIDYLYAQTDGTYGSLHQQIGGNVKYIRDQIRKHNKENNKHH